MKRTTRLYLASLAVAVGLAQAPLHAAVSIISLTPSVASPQTLGTTVTWTAKATDSGAGPVTFQFNVAYGTGSYTLARGFNAGTLSAGTWTSQPFAWNTIQGEGTYTIQVIAKDFGTGQTAVQTATFTLNAFATTRSAVKKVNHPLVALFGIPPCAIGRSVRVAFSTGTNPINYTNWVNCNGSVSVNFYVAGMLPSTTYAMYSQTMISGKITNGTPLSFTTGALPASLPPQHLFPAFTVNAPAGPNTDITDSMLLWSFTKFWVPTATDLNGNIIWYYANGTDTLVTRPIAGGTLLTIQDGPTWNSITQVQQVLREIDLAGNTIRETNTGIISQQLVAKGATDGISCGIVKNPQVGTGCLDDFHHDAIRLPNGDTAFFAHIEKLFPPGTQGSTTGLSVDILSEMLIVLDSNWQVKWYYDAFQHASGAPQLDINRAAPLGEICTSGGGTGDCPTKLALAPGAPGTVKTANDWTHSNTICYIPPVPPSTHDYFLVSVRDQDWLIKIDYNGGTGNANILWRMGNEGDFTITDSSTWAWFSHQHDAGIESNGLLTLFDNGNTRVSPPPLGLGSGVSRGMALSFDESTRLVTPVLSVSLFLPAPYSNTYAPALGSAQLLSNGNYFFQAGIPLADAIQILPTPGTTTGTQVLNVSSADYSYRAWQMPSFYNPPTT